MKQFNKISEIIKAFRNNSFFDEIILFGGSSKIPRLKKMIQSQFKNIINTQMNADSIAFGASLYSRWQVYGKVMPFSLGFEKKDGQFRKLIHNGSFFPIRKTYNAKISREKKEFNLRIYQGEHMIAKNNKFLFDSTYYLTNSMTKKESAEIEVLFDVDSFGILTVHVQLIIFVYDRQIRKESLSNHSPIYKYFIVCGALIAIFTILFYIKNK